LSHPGFILPATEREKHLPNQRGLKILLTVPLAW
jgi:hypothetical protein